ncbi:MAG: hypothetical protein NDF54_02225 [archaeon GB-1867-035]|nr:hypothetical protein [Candidatus Culexmicrobium profundum]
MGLIRRLQLSFSPALVLFFLSPMIAELLSGSSPPVEFFNPLSFIMLISLYGSGAIIMRELKIRWKKGIGSLLLLGAAYGIIEEGLMVASFFNPNWPDVGILGVFGRWLDVNWVWALELTVYHAVVSIVVPIFLVELAYPELRSKSWVSNKALKFLISLFVGVVCMGFILVSVSFDYWPPLLQYVLMFLLAVLLIYLAYKFPANWARVGSKPLRSPLFFGLISLLSMVAGAIIFGILPYFMHFQFSPVIVIFLGLLLIFGVLGFIRRYNWREATDLHKFALVAGILLPFIAIAPLQEFDPNRTDNPVGMSFVGLISLVLLILLGWKVKKRINSDMRSQYKTKFKFNLSSSVFDRVLCILSLPRIMKVFAVWFLAILILTVHWIFNGGANDRTIGFSSLICGFSSLFIWRFRAQLESRVNRWRWRPKTKFIFLGGIGALWVEFVFWLFERIFNASSIAASSNLLLDWLITMPWYLMMTYLLWYVVNKYLFSIFELLLLGGFMSFGLMVF